MNYNVLICVIAIIILLGFVFYFLSGYTRSTHTKINLISNPDDKIKLTGGADTEVYIHLCDINVPIIIHTGLPGFMERQENGMIMAAMYALLGFDENIIRILELDINGLSWMTLYCLMRSYFELTFIPEIASEKHKIITYEEDSTDLFCEDGPCMKMGKLLKKSSTLFCIYTEERTSRGDYRNQCRQNNDSIDWFWTTKYQFLCSYAKLVPEEDKKAFKTIANILINTFTEDNFAMAKGNISALLFNNANFNCPILQQYYTSQVSQDKSNHKVIIDTVLFKNLDSIHFGLASKIQIQAVYDIISYILNATGSDVQIYGIYYQIIQNRNAIYKSIREHKMTQLFGLMFYKGADGTLISNALNTQDGMDKVIALQGKTKPSLGIIISNGAISYCEENKSWECDGLFHLYDPSSKSFISVNIEPDELRSDKMVKDLTPENIEVFSYSMAQFVNNIIPNKPEFIDNTDSRESSQNLDFESNSQPVVNISMGNENIQIPMKSSSQEVTKITLEDIIEQMDDLYTLDSFFNFGDQLALPLLPSNKHFVKSLIQWITISYCTFNPKLNKSLSVVNTDTDKGSEIITNFEVINYIPYRVDDDDILSFLITSDIDVMNESTRITFHNKIIELFHVLVHKHINEELTRLKICINIFNLWYNARHKTISDNNPDMSILYAEIMSLYKNIYRSYILNGRHVVYINMFVTLTIISNIAGIVDDEINLWKYRFLAHLLYEPNYSNSFSIILLIRLANPVLLTQSMNELLSNVEQSSIVFNDDLINQYLFQQFIAHTQNEKYKNNIQYQIANMKTVINIICLTFCTRFNDNLQHIYNDICDLINNTGFTSHAIDCIIDNLYEGSINEFIYKFYVQQLMPKTQTDQ